MRRHITDSTQNPNVPVFAKGSCSLSQKTSRKTDKLAPEELDVTTLTDQDLRAELLKHGADVGPVVGEH